MAQIEYLSQNWEVIWGNKSDPTDENFLAY